MTRTRLDHVHCSLARTADIIGDKWCLLILRDVFIGIDSFSSFQRNSGIAKNILADRLQRLIDHEVLQKTPTRPGVERYKYSFTEQGKALVPILVAMMQWGDRWIFDDDSKPLEILARHNQQPIQPIQMTSSDGNVLHADDIEPAPGPGATTAINAAF